MATNNGLDCRRVQPNFCPCIPTLIPIVPLKKSDSQGCYPSTIEVISPSEYPAGSTSVSVRLKISDAKGLHQVLLIDVERESAGAAGGMPWMWTARKTQSSNSRGAVRNISYLTQPALCAARNPLNFGEPLLRGREFGMEFEELLKDRGGLVDVPEL